MRRLSFVAQQALIVAVSCLAIAGAGTLIVPREAIALRCAIGMAVWAQTLFLLALTGQLRVAPVAILVLIAMAALWRKRVAPRDIPIVFALLFAIMFIVALRPPLAFDETLYHLPFVQALAESGSLAFRTDLRFPVFPQLHELLCVPVFFAGGDVATHVVALIEVAITAALLFDWGRRFSRGAGLLSAALFLGSPIVVHLGTINHVDAALTLFVAAGFYCLDQRRFMLAGVFLGTACSVKYLGGYFAVAALVIVLICDRRAAARFAACCTAAALPTTLWLTVTAGDPLFPFLRNSLWTLSTPAAPVAVHIDRIVRVAWDVTFARDRVNMEPPFTPFFIVMLAIVVFAARRDHRARAVAFMTLGYAIVFTFLPQDSRYLVALLPLISAVSGVALAAVVRSANLISILAVSPAIAYAVFILSVRGLPPVTPSGREQFLRDRVPAYSALTRAGRDTVYACGGEQLKAYARGRFLGDFAGPYSFDRVLGHARTTSTIAAGLRRIGAQDYLAASRTCVPVRNDGGMDLVYDDGAAQLWRVRYDRSVR